MNKKQFSFEDAVKMLVDHAYRLHDLEHRERGLEATFKKNDLLRRVEALEKK